MSPEVCRSEPYNWKSDIWVVTSVGVAAMTGLRPVAISLLKALGCVLYERPS